MSSAQPHVIVIGAGIIGASTAWHLARGGARVTILEAGVPGALATGHSWAWINASWGNPEPYFRLRRRAMAEWRTLAAAVTEIPIDWAGGLLWDLPAEKLAAYAAEHASWGYDIRLVDRDDALRIEPALATPPDRAVHVASEGAVDPLAATLALLRAAQALGAELMAPRTVLALERVAGRVVGVRTDAGSLTADHVVLAAGAVTASLAATTDIHVPMSAPAGLLVITRPCAKILNGLVMAPELHVRQREDGSLIAGTDFGGADPGTEPQRVAEAIMTALQSLLRSDAGIMLDRYTVGYRPLPADGFPAVGQPAGCPGLTIAVTHSGVTLAPILGQAMAEEILTGRVEPLLAPYRLDRFAAALP